jgi:hypothetical protein
MVYDFGFITYHINYLNPQVHKLKDVSWEIDIIYIYIYISKQVYTRRHVLAVIGVSVPTRKAKPELG